MSQGGASFQVSVCLVRLTLQCYFFGVSMETKHKIILVVIGALVAITVGLLASSFARLSSTEGKKTGVIVLVNTLLLVLSLLTVARTICVHKKKTKKNSSPVNRHQLNKTA